MLFLKLNFFFFTTERIEGHTNVQWEKSKLFWYNLYQIATSFFHSFLTINQNLSLLLILDSVFFLWPPFLPLHNYYWHLDFRFPLWTWICFTAETIGETSALGRKSLLNFNPIEDILDICWCPKKEVFRQLLCR